VHAGEEGHARPGWTTSNVDRTLRGRVNQNDRGQGQMEKVRPRCGQPTDSLHSDRGRLKNRTEQVLWATLEIQTVPSRRQLMGAQESGPQYFGLGLSSTGDCTANIRHFLLIELFSFFGSTLFFYLKSVWTAFRTLIKLMGFGTA